LAGRGCIAQLSGCAVDFPSLNWNWIRNRKRAANDIHCMKGFQALSLRPPKIAWRFFTGAIPVRRFLMALGKSVMVWGDLFNRPICGFVQMHTIATDLIDLPLPHG
jgi:hypothetical protein